LGALPCAAFDLLAACSGYGYSLSMARGMVVSGQARHVLVVGSEVLSKETDYQDRTSCILFGDGAGAIVVEPTDDESRSVLGWVLHSDGAHAEDLVCPAPTSLIQGRITPEMVAEGRHYPQMNGRQVFKHATTRFPEVIHEVLAQIGRTLADVKLIVPHQANQRIGDAVGQRLGVPPELVFQNIAHYGPGDLLVLAAFGSGFGWGATALRW
jgi:3-oxoacyl-[acyl-carrier-protein] synthase-3